MSLSKLPPIRVVFVLVAAEGLIPLRFIPLGKSPFVKTSGDRHTPVCLLPAGRTPDQRIMIYQRTKYFSSRTPQKTATFICFVIVDV